MYEKGEGGSPKDLAKATDLYIKSAKRGFDKAQLAISVRYELVPRSGSRGIAELANVLADRNTTVRFANGAALGDYLAGLRSAQSAAAWARARASCGVAGTGRGGDPYNSGAPPTHCD